jgi:hypothetical protein
LLQAGVSVRLVRGGVKVRGRTCSLGTTGIAIRCSKAVHRHQTRPSDLRFTFITSKHIVLATISYSVLLLHANASSYVVAHADSSRWFCSTGPL